MNFLGNGGNLNKMKCGSLVGFLFSVIIALYFVLIVGCVPKYARLYDGPRLPANEVAILRLYRNMVLHEVDGKKRLWFTYTNRRRCNFRSIQTPCLEIQLLPGPHILKVSYRALHMNKSGKSGVGLVTLHTMQLSVLKLQAEAGCTYTVENHFFDEFHGLRFEVDENGSLYAPRPGVRRYWKPRVVEIERCTE